MLPATLTDLLRVSLDMEVMDMEDMVMEVTMVREMLMLSQVMVMPPATLTDPHRVSLLDMEVTDGGSSSVYRSTQGLTGGYGYGYYGKRDAEPGYGYGSGYSFVHQSRPYYHGSYGYNINHSYGKRSAEPGYGYGYGIANSYQH